MCGAEIYQIYRYRLWCALRYLAMCPYQHFILSAVRSVCSGSLRGRAASRQVRAPRGSLSDSVPDVPSYLTVFVLRFMLLFSS